MSPTWSLRATLALGSALTTLLAAGPALAQDADAGMIEELVVTAQRREEALQSVPIAVSAFSQEGLEAQKIDGGYNLVHAVPNLNFSKGNFTSYNFQVRGIGSKTVAASADTGVGVHLNNAPLLTNRLFEADFFDVERVEVLRGPQGTLYGRNATGGVVNVITAKPSLDLFEGQVRAETGSYDSVKARGFVNIPLGELAALRLAGSYLKRDGFGTNTTLATDVDDRDLYGWRATLRFEPFDGLRVLASYDHFKEDDRRVRAAKMVCAKDTGPTSVGGVPVNNPLARNLQSQGCRNVSIYDPAAMGAINTVPTIGGIFGLLNGVLTTDAYAGKVQNPDLRTIESAVEPIYRAKEDVFQLGIEMDVTDHLTLSLLSAASADDYFTFQDYNRVASVTPFTVPAPLAPLFNNGNFFNDPQVGNTNLFRTFDISAADSEQVSHELRLQSDFSGPVNFNVGALYIDYDITTHYFVFANTLTIAARTNNPIPGRYVDPNFPPAGDGHNYFYNTSPFSLRTYAVFGELYWQASDALKFTAGARFNDDRKSQITQPVGLTTPGRGFNPAGVGVLEAPFKATTGRIGFDWQADTGLTDRTLVYGFYSRGYKPGGLNPQCSAGLSFCPPSTFEAEFVNSFEVGAKNLLLDGTMVLNLAAFHYDYRGYQISKIVNRTAVNENIDAKIMGAEFEAVWEPVRGFRLNGALGLLDTEIQGGSSIDVLNRTQGDPALSLVSGTLAGSNCVVPTAALAAFNAAANATPALAQLLLQACAGALRTGSTPATGNPLAPAGIFLNPTDGVAVSLDGKRLPNSPKATFNVGAQYRLEFAGGWQAIARADYYRQSGSFARFFNSPSDRLKGYENLNLSVTVSNDDYGLALEGFVKNATGVTAITDSYLTDDSSGLFRNIFLTEPRIYGVALTKSF